jgi:hypothetical protein
MMYQNHNLRPISRTPCAKSYETIRVCIPALLRDRQDLVPGRMWRDSLSNTHNFVSTYGRKQSIEFVCIARE